ncbi:MAG TPA: glycosyltransferase family 2 protein [Anaerolineae bacterium]|nr:glycosyltransferase family 2 protein [Anaerolineae bacterium]HQI83838.1 glycosyltransferase family 2 protein [Anaerolineae bacterium]
MNSHIPLVNVVIPSWNGQALLVACLEALQQQTLRDFAVYVVDNGSTDGSVAYLAEHFPQAKVITNTQNLGFATAVNQGIRAGQSRYVAVLNNDTEVSPDWLAVLVSTAENSPDVGMCASKMLFADNAQMINSTGICVDRVGMVWDRRGGESDDAAEVGPVEIFGPCGGAALYRREMLDAIGLFDEDFFAYMEDVDLAWRARIAGWRCMYVPQARVLHRHSSTGKEGSPFKSFHLGRNKVWLIAKNYPFYTFWYYVPLLLFYDVLAVLFMFVMRGDVHTLRGRWAGWRRISQMWRKRPHISTTERKDIAYLLAPVWPWRVLHRYQHLSSTALE